MLGKTIVVLGFLHYETIVGLRDTKAASGNNNNIVEYENLTGIEAGLLTTTRSSSIWTILISSDETGTSCLKKIKKQLIFRRPKKICLFVEDFSWFLIRHKNIVHEFPWFYFINSDKFSSCTTFLLLIKNQENHSTNRQKKILESLLCSCSTKSASLHLSKKMLCSLGPSGLGHSFLS